MKYATVTIVYRNHLFPFRTEKLRLYALMILQMWKSKCRQGLRLRFTDYARDLNLVKN